MVYLNRMRIHGLKKFGDFDIQFNENTNILVGDNESGKSTILDAISIVLAQKYKNFDKYIIKELLNKKLVDEFIANPKPDSLPYIQIDLELMLDPSPNSGLYFGTIHGFEKNKPLYGVRFQCKIPDDMIAELAPVIESGQIPYDYYQMTWNTFQGDTYNTFKKPLNFLLIDNDDIDSSTSYNYYNKSLFANKHSKKEQTEIKNQFRSSINNVFKELHMNQISADQKFGINEKKTIFENIITILDDDIPIENKGKGRENILKTKIALDKSAGIIDVLAIEEPEAHLSFTSLKQMIKEIQVQNGRQIIITTHESMIVSGLNLRNVLWIKDDQAESFNYIKKDDAKFFFKTSNNNMLQYILSPKVILVEGPTEYMLIPRIFEKLFGKSLEECGIAIIDCGGIKYKRYLDIADQDKKVLVITDNDAKQSNLDYQANYNTEHDNIRICMDKSLENWTWEVCFYNLNKDRLKQIIQPKENAVYKFNDKEYEQTLGKMLNNKVESAYAMCNEKDFDFTIPEYIGEGLKWLKEQS